MLGLAEIFAISRGRYDAATFVPVIGEVERIKLLYLAGCFLGGLAGLWRAFSQVTTITARRQLRWIAWGTAVGAAPFAFGYALPYAFGVDPSLPMELSVIPLSLIPLAYTSAIVRYRLMDIEVIVKRALVYAAALSAIVLIYAVLLEGVGVPEVRTQIEGQHVLIVVRGYDYRSDLAALRPYISEYRPLLMGVDGGADALIEAGYQPDMIIGDMDSCSDETLRSGAELVVHAYHDGRAPGFLLPVCPRPSA